MSDKKAFFFFWRRESNGTEAGWTVSKKEKLPRGDFRITDYSWPYTKLWFIDDDNFTVTERQQAFVAHINNEVSRQGAEDPKTLLQRNNHD